jgi:hypothetical protein
MWREVSQPGFHVCEVVSGAVTLFHKAMLLLLAAIVSNVLNLNSLHARDLTGDGKLFRADLHPIDARAVLTRPVHALPLVEVDTQHEQRNVVVSPTISARAHEALSHGVGVSNVLDCTCRTGRLPEERRDAIACLPFATSASLRTGAPTRNGANKGKGSFPSAPQSKALIVSFFADSATMLLTSRNRPFRKPLWP